MTCETCKWWKRDAPFHAMNGTEIRNTGECRIRRDIVRKNASDWCGEYQPKEKSDE